MIKVNYIMHSCFAVEIEDTLLLFDYFDKSKTPEVDFEGELPDFSKYKKHFIFASHKHRDHFWLDSLKWGMEYPQMIFFLGNDMRFNEKYLARNGIDPALKERMITAKPGGRYEAGELKVQAYGSTDEGVSFLVHYQGKTIFHAGDLNDWSWEVRKGEFHDEAYRNRMRDEFRRELEPLRGIHMDIACVVMDMRLEERYKNGIDYFLHEMDADVIFPMHMWKRYDLISVYKKELIAKGEVDLAEKIMDIQKENQVFELP